MRRPTGKPESFGSTRSHQDVPFDAETAAGVRVEIDALACWLGLEVDLAG